MSAASGEALRWRLALAGAVVVGMSWLAARVTRPAPPTIAEVRAGHHPSDVALLDRDGEILQVLRTDAHRRRLEWVPLAAVSPALVRAVVEAEDRRFRAHGGVDLRAVAGALLQRVRGGPRRGASTIAMQLAALLEPGLGGGARPRTWAQKWRQMRVARALVRGWTRDEILEAYLNRVTFRGEIEGIGAAAWLLVGKAPHGLTDAEAMALAALVPAPNAPFPAVAARARALAAARVVSGGCGASAPRVSTCSGADGAPPVAAETEIAEIDAAVRAVTGAVPLAAARNATLAPHLAHRLLRAGGGPVRSTLDARVQRVAAQALQRNLAELGARVDRTSTALARSPLDARGDAGGEDRHVQDGAVLVADNATGDVLAYVGGSGRLSRARFVDTVQARRQPGSTLKPFLYALALERRVLTAASLLEDAPLAVAVAGGLYRPRDYDQAFHGLVSLRTALAASLNVPAVRTLGLVGGDAFVDLLRALGLTGVVESGDYYGPALALGSSDVSLWELVGAYRALAAGGVWRPLRVRADEVAPAEGRRVVDEAAAFLVGDVLADRESRSATFGLESALATRFWSAVKTGTSEEMRDNWCIGWSRRYTVGVWVGNAAGDPMHDVSGVAGAAPVWLEVMAWLHRAAPSLPPVPPPGVVATIVTFAEGIEPPRREWFIAGTEPRDGTQRLASDAPRIVVPVAGTVVALDPDIPRAQQRLALEARGGAAARWQVDGEDVGSAARLRLWEPRPGPHTVALVDAVGHALDRASFEVRGGASRQP